MATATSPPPGEDRTPKRQKGEDAMGETGNTSGFPSRGPPQQHPSQMYPPGYMQMGGGGAGGGPHYMNGGPPGGMPPYHGQYPGANHPHAPPPHHQGMYGGGMYGGPPGSSRGHSSPDRPGRGPPPPGAGGHWSGSSGAPGYPPQRGGPPPSGKKDDKDGPPPSQQPPPPHYPPPGGWGHPQSWQQAGPYGAPPPGYPGGHPSMAPGGGAGMYNGPGNGGWNGGGGGAASSGNPGGSDPRGSGSKSPMRNRPRPESDTPTRQPHGPPTTQPVDARGPQAQAPSQPQPSQSRLADGSNNAYCMEVNSSGRASVTQDMMNEEGSSVSGSTKDKARGSYKCGRCGVPKKGHICPYQPKLKRRPDEPPPETRNAAVQVEMDEFMTLRRLNIRIQGFPESYATEPFMGASMVGSETHPPMGADPFLSSGGPAMDPNHPHAAQHHPQHPHHAPSHMMGMDDPSNPHHHPHLHRPPPPPPHDPLPHDAAAHVPSAAAGNGENPMPPMEGAEPKNGSPMASAAKDTANPPPLKADGLETEGDPTAKEEKTEAV